MSPGDYFGYSRRSDSTLLAVGLADGICFAGGVLVGCADSTSSGMLDHNRVFLDVPQPQQFDWGFPFFQVVMPVSLGSFIFGVGAYNMDVKNTMIRSAPQDFVLAYALETWDAHNYSVKGTTYAGVPVLPWRSLIANRHPRREAF